MTVSKAPRNPFRKPQVEEKKTVLLTTLQVVYVIGVFALFVAVTCAAVTLLPDVVSPPPPLPDSNGNSAAAASSSSSSESLNEPLQLQIQQQQQLRKGGGVRSQSIRNPPVEKRSPPLLYEPTRQSSSGNHPRDGIAATSTIDDTINNEDGGEEGTTLSSSLQQQQQYYEEDLVHMQQADPAGANLKIIDEAKAQVREELRQQEAAATSGGEHAEFGADETDSEMEGRNRTSRHNKTKSDGTGHGTTGRGHAQHAANGLDSRGSDEVHVVQRKGEGSSAGAAVVIGDRVVSGAAATPNMAKASVEVASDADDHSNHQHHPKQDTGADGHLHKRTRPIAVTADKKA